VSPEDLFPIDSKAVFSLSSTPRAEKYTCLVKKIKENLMAVVISNRDKETVSITVGDEIFFFVEKDGETWIMGSKLIQDQSFPLIIVSITGEAEPHIVNQDAPSNVSGEVESAENDHVVDASEMETLEYTPATQESTDGWSDETPLNRFSKEEDLLANELKDEEIESILSEPAKPSGPKDEFSRISKELEDIPDIDTKDLDAELTVDIERSLDESPVDSLFTDDDTPEKEKATELQAEQAPEYPPGQVDDIFDEMEITEPAEVDLGDIDESTPPKEEPPDDAQELDEEVTAARHDELFVNKTDERAAAGTQNEFAEDFFGFSFLIVDSQAAERLEGVISKHSTAERTALDQAADLETLDMGDDVQDNLKNAINTTLARVSRLESVVTHYLGHDMLSAEMSLGGLNAEKAKKPLRKAVCLSIDRAGALVALDKPLHDGTNVLMFVDRPWQKQLRFDAIAVVFESQTSEDGIHTAMFRFVAIHPDDAFLIDDYLSGWRSFRRLLKSALGE